ncbi:MAG: HU family DNA-binding protein [Kiritimatiellae bacterium]|nr:HU family DNA-binding protein [Kiritimatiellia bacterium]
MATKKMEKPLTKTELLGNISDKTGLSKKEVVSVLVELEANIKKSLGKSGCGKFVLPGLLKVEKVKVAARPARKGVPNPFKPGELMDVKAKPASTKIKVRPLKTLKSM